MVPIHVAPFAGFVGCKAAYVEDLPSKVHEIHPISSANHSQVERSDAFPTSLPLKNPMLHSSENRHRPEMRDSGYGNMLFGIKIEKTR